MTPERWQQIDRLFHAALGHDPAVRPAFLARACAEDEALRQEVESLLASHEQAESFIETPAADVAAELLAAEQARLMAGQAVGPFKIVDALAAGGMGEVYLADDTRLGRRVALKLLPPQFTADADRVRRFGQEARAASALNHPNIVTIHEIGESDSLHYIAAEYVEGETLREHMADTRMTPGEVLDVAAQVASALQAAHEAGVVHRDVKPENVMLRRDGIVKVLDFGLAKLAPRQAVAAHPRAPARPAVQTNPGVVMGTVVYMSPEQARGLEVDERTDIWSLGVVLYEMLAGRAPFTGETPSHVIVSIMEDEPPPLSRDAEVPAELERIISKALRKERGARYRTAGEAARELKRLKEELEVEARLGQGRQPNADGKESAAAGDGFGSVAAARERGARTGHVVPARRTMSVEHIVGRLERHKSYVAAALLVLLVGTVGLTYLAVKRDKAEVNPRGKKSLAVLPLRPIDAAAREEIYEIGIADSLIHRLSSTKGLIVRPLSATRKYADPVQDPLAAGKEQQVDYVLASNYQLAGGKIRVTAQLLDVASGQIEETKIIEKDAGHIFATQDAIAGEVGNLLLARFGIAWTNPAANAGTTSEEAYRLYLQGKNLMDRSSEEEMRKAVGYFERAIRLDPNFARAYAAMARAFHVSGGLGPDPTSEGNEKARNALNTALELDPDLADAYVARGDLSLKTARGLDEVEKDLLRALELEPNNDLGHWVYALTLAYRGRTNEAVAENDIALAIAPGNLTYQRDRGRLLYYARRYDEAIEQLGRVLELNGNYVSGWGWLFLVHEVKGDTEGAYRAFMEVQKRSNPERVEIYRKAYETGGWQAVRRQSLEFGKLGEQKPGADHFALARSCALLGDEEQALEYLNTVVERREWRMVWMTVDPALDSLRDDPRFDELVRRAGLK